jgi:hypothetical protein
VSVVSRGGSEDRAELRCRVLHKGRQREFLGFCRASNAVIESAILATRLALHDRKTVGDRMIHYGEIVEKTGDEAARQAFRLVQDYVRKREE